MAALNPLPESPVSLANDGAVPHVIIRSSRLWHREFDSHAAKRLLQQNRHFDNVNPQAPKGGAGTLGSARHFRQLQPDNSRAQELVRCGCRHDFDTLMVPSLDEASPQYGLIAE